MVGLLLHNSLSYPTNWGNEKIGQNFIELEEKNDRLEHELMAKNEKLEKELHGAIHKIQELEKAQSQREICKSALLS